MLRARAHVRTPAVRGLRPRSRGLGQRPLREQALVGVVDLARYAPAARRRATACRTTPPYLVCDRADSGPLLRPAIRGHLARASAHQLTTSRGPRDEALRNSATPTVAFRGKSKLGVGGTKTRDPNSVP